MPKPKKKQNTPYAMLSKITLLSFFGFMCSFEVSNAQPLQCKGTEGKWGTGSFSFHVMGNCKKQGAKDESEKLQFTYILVSPKQDNGPLVIYLHTGSIQDNDFVLKKTVRCPHNAALKPPQKDIDFQLDFSSKNPGKKEASYKDNLTSLHCIWTEPTSDDVTLLQEVKHIFPEL